MSGHDARIHGLGGERRRNHLFRGVCVVICGPVQEPTTGLIEDMHGMNLKHTTHREDGPVLRWFEQGGKHPPQLEPYFRR